ncbi:MAG: succinyl-diaminopimelate desuccinylase [Planctomycetota bacterium]
MSEALQRVVRSAVELLEIPSETGDEGRIAEHLMGRLGGAVLHRLVRAGHSIAVAPRPLDPSRRTVMLLGHSDTVPAHGDEPVRQDGDRLYGLGASDMKGALAVMLEIASRTAAEAPRDNLILVFYAAEEGSYAGNELPVIREAVSEWFGATDLGLCLEPTDGRLELGCLGTAHATVTFGGTRAHSARPWQGENAIHKAAPLLQRLAARGTASFTFDGLEFVESMSATTVGFRGARNVVPDRFQLNVNYRFAPGKTEHDVRTELEQLVAGEATCELIDFCPSGRVCRDNALLQELARAAGDPPVAAKQAWTDVGRLSQWGIDAANWGPGATSQAHQAGEWVSIMALGAALTALERWQFG